MKAGSSSCLGRKGEGAFLVPGSRFRLRPDGSRCYLLLIPRDSVRKKVGEGVGVGGRGVKGSFTSERLSLDGSSPHPTGPDQGPSDSKRTAREAQGRATEFF